MLPSSLITNFNYLLPIGSLNNHKTTTLFLLGEVLYVIYEYEWGRVCMNVVSYLLPNLIRTSSKCIYYLIIQTNLKV